MARVYPDQNGDLWLAEGDYGQEKDGTWIVRPPGCHSGTLMEHEVTEHDDGTISVTPSIRSEWGDSHYWHGFLTKGEWKEL